MSTGWNLLDPLAMVGTPSGGVADDVSTGQLGAAQVLALPSSAHPDHPLFWFAGIAAVTVGLIGASTHLRVGPFRASFDAGHDEDDKD